MSRRQTKDVTCERCGRRERISRLHTLPDGWWRLQFRQLRDRPRDKYETACAEICDPCARAAIAFALGRQLELEVGS